MADDNKIVLTSEGFKRLQDELSERKTTKTAEITARLAEARAQGDLSENSEYDDAKEAQGLNADRIKEIEEILKRAEVLSDDEISTKQIDVGSTFTLRDEETKEETVYQLVEAAEQDIFANKLSKDSPIGQVIVGKKKGNVVEVSTVAGTFKYKIMKIGK